MVPQQVLRSAAGLAALAVAAGLPAGDARAQSIETVAVVDLRAGPPEARRPAREAVLAALREQAGLWPTDDAELAAALAGERFDPMAREATDALASARSAYGSLDCATAAAAGERAVNALAASQASGAAVTDALVQAYVYVLLCSADEPARALAVAARLRALGADPPPGVSPSVWDKYPAIDATSNIFLVDVAIASEPPGATVWIDHREVGAAPLRVHLPEGEHVVAIANATGSRVERLVLRGRDPRALSLAIAPSGSARWQAVRAWVDGWRDGSRAPTPHDIHGLLTTANLHMAILLTTHLESRADRVEAWGAPPGRDDATAVLIGSGGVDQLAELSALLASTAQAWASGEPTPDPTPIPAPGEPDGNGKAKPWWVYASIVGAIVVGGAIVLANDLADDRQVIRLRYP